MRERSECETQVTGLHYNAYQSFASADEALVEFALGWVTHMVDQVTAVKPAGLDLLIRLSQDELVQRLHPYGRGHWYVVYKGRCPGVYPAWYVLYYESEIGVDVYVLGVLWCLK